ncbi:MAG: ATP-binding protein, partial [bacterium]|nr:ATP-binding protein [bacterium]
SGGRQPAGRADAGESRETMDGGEGGRRVLDHPEWLEEEEGEEAGAPGFEFAVATDAQFNTLKQTPNLGRLEIQQFHRFEPTSTPQSFFFNIDDMRLMCVVVPVKNGDAVVAYILAGANVEQMDGYIEILNDTVVITLIVVMLLGMGLAYGMANRMVRPVLSIQQAVGEIDLENLDRRIELIQGDSEVQRLVETLNDLFERLEKSYNQINDFSSNVAHELQTPLTILRGNIEVALTQEREKAEYIEMLSDLLEETMHIIHIVDSLLLLARSDTSSLTISQTPIDLAQFCEEQAKDWEAVCSLKQQKLTLNVQGIHQVAGDQNLLAQLFLNLISNASKYSDAGLAVQVDVRKQAFNGSEGVQIMVEDQGVGIPEIDQDKVFERFYRVDKDRSRETGGAGLGLSICQMIARLHGGDIALTSAVGVGTRVSVVLPALGS